ncbi:hypothetical protein R75465_06442 [Paraburkholderia aspalathi]|uniref:Imm8 family immunity protein n=1 Tax=Paraburkholderia aspalathi TaxID=1324617 RepID=UPI001B1929D9|nr:Imm8 family immunity protein [Paraburkholderia aspalathi]CAE6834941.1 hypothetical protein R75465_06442 [Paraburkholderia aspalathi]
MGLLAVRHLDPVVGVDVHSVLVAPGPTPVFLPHPHVGFMLDLREYVEAAKGVVGSIAMMIVQEKVTEYIDDHPDEVKKVDHLADSAMQHANDLAGVMGGKLPDIKDNAIVAEGLKLNKERKALQSRISNDLGSNVGMGGSSGRPIFVNGLMRATAGTHAYHIPGLHFPLGESFAPPTDEDSEPSNDGESFMGSKTVLANSDPMSFMALQALSCWSIGMEPPSHNSAHTDRTYPSMPSSVMLPIPVGRPVLVGGPPVMNMAATAKGLFKAFQGSDWAKALADKLHLKSGFLRCTVLHAEPVDAITGEVVVQQHDFTVAGRLPLVWDRYYASHDTRRGAIGVGWQTPADIRLELMRHEGAVGVAAYFPDHATAFDAMPDATGWPARVYDWQHGHGLYRRDDRLVLRTRAGIEHEFALPVHWQHAVEVLAEDATLTLPVGRMADLNGNAWVFEREPDSSLARLVEWKGAQATGRVIGCEAGAGSQIGGQANLLTALMLIDAGGGAHPLVGYEYDRDGNLVAALDAMSQPHHFAYGDSHRMVRHTSARGGSFYYCYQQHDDEVWRVDRAWGDNGLADYRFVYDVGHRETQITDSLGHVTVLQANECGVPVARIDPLGGVTSYRYDAKGRTSAETDPAGRTTAWAYDAYGNLLAETLADGSVVRAEYGADHKPVCVTAPGERQWRYMWDERGKLLAQTTPAQATSRYDYDAHGQVVSRTGPCGAVTRFGYDQDGNLAELIDALGHRAWYTYDARANVIQTVNALSQVSRYDYDRNGNLTRAIEPGEREITCRYDAEGNLTRYRDANGHVTQFEYSPLGQITRRVTPDGGVVEYRYDTEEQLVGVVNERGEQHRIERDALGQIVEEGDYWGQSRRYEYGAAGELLRSIDPLGQAIDYEADALGRILQKRVPDPRQPDGIRTETFSYDRSGNLTVAANPDCRVELAYDAAGRVVEERQGDDFVIVSAYDAAGNRIERRPQLKMGGKIIAHTVRYGYDALDEVSSIQMDDAAPLTFERDVLGQIRVEHLGAVLRRELSYTSEGLLAKQALFSGTGPLFAREYAYDANGELLEKRDSHLGIERYQYDPVGRLTGHLDPAGKLHRFLYDLAGDLLKTRVRQGHQAGVLGQGPQTDTWIREGEYEGCYYAFDRGGNLVRKQDPRQDLTLCWDGDGLLIESLSVRQALEAVGGSGGTLGIRTRYEYDAFHRRTKKTTQIQHNIAIRTGAGSDCTTLSRTSCFFWVGDVLLAEVKLGDRDADRLLMETSSGARTSQSNAFVRATGLNNWRPGTTGNCGEVREWVVYPNTFVPLAEIRHAYALGAPAPTAGDVQITPHETGKESILERQQDQALHTGRENRDPVTTPLLLDLMLEPSALHYFHTDPNGAPARTTDAAGAVMWEIRYAALGDVSPMTIRTEFDQPLRCQGQYFDEESGLHYNRYRYFDPQTSSFISQDPIGLDGGINPYQFAPNVFGWIDPLGLSTKSFRNKLRQIMEKAEEKEGNSGCRFAVDRRTANNLGKEFVGEDHTTIRGRNGELWLISSDELRLYRSPSAKSSDYARTGKQANFHIRRSKRSGFFDEQSSSNVHVHVKKMKLIIHSIHAGNGDNLRTWVPENELVVSEFIYISIGEKGKKTGDGFSIRVATPDGLRQLAPENGILATRPLLVMVRYSFGDLWKWLNDVVSSCEGETWIECVENLRIYFNWEFDNYQA